MINQSPSNILRDRRAISLWLLTAALLVACMVVLGGYTRLSGSGLSITEWKPIHGTLPPLNETQWQEEFAGYQASPQYRQINKGMRLDEFKTIFWPEFLHRLLGRAVGIVFFIPFLIFFARRSFSACFGWRLIGIFVLGGLQGLIGWLMVKSGLIDNPQVSPLRLALHLLVAFAILGFILWSFLDTLSRRRPGSRSYSTREGKGPDPGLRRDDNKKIFQIAYAFWFTLLIFQLFLGALMAGLHAGLIYNTWPTMNGQWIPNDAFSDNTPWYADVTIVQFLHRTVAIAVAPGFLLWWYAARTYVKNNALGKVCAGVALVILSQFVLGVVTLLHQAPLPLALTHQLVGLLLFVSAVMLMHGLSSLRGA